MVPADTELLNINTKITRLTTLLSKSDPKRGFRCRLLALGCEQDHTDFVPLSYFHF